MKDCEISDSISCPELKRYRALVLGADKGFDGDEEKYIKTAFPNDPELQKKYLQNTTYYREKLELEMLNKKEGVELCETSNLINMQVIKIMKYVNFIFK